MPPKIRKTYSKKNKENIITNKSEDENLNDIENVYSRLRKRENKKQDSKLQPQKVDSDEEFEKLLLSPKNQEVVFKPLTFWSKKLKDLENEKEKKKKCGLYEFSETDESQSPFKKKKKPRKKDKTVAKKKEKLEIKYCNFNKLCSKVPRTRCKTREKEVKIKKNSPDVKHCMIEEQNQLNEEKEVLKNKEEQIASSIVCSPLRITSTPAVNKANLIKPSDFMFLSPVVREENNENVEIQNNLSKCGQSNVFKTPKREKKPCRVNERVLRSRKIVFCSKAGS